MNKWHHEKLSLRFIGIQFRCRVKDEFIFEGSFCDTGRPGGILLHKVILYTIAFSKSLSFEFCIGFWIRTHLQTVGLNHLIKTIAGSQAIVIKGYTASCYVCSSDKLL